MTSLAQVAQHAADLDRAAAFYTRLLGAAPIARFDPPGLCSSTSAARACCSSGVPLPR
jgi:catechol 2,3-dioxygenase-like lactoylglutathione lyase family enzyme